MNGAILGIYSALLFGVVAAGNSKTLIDYVKEDAGGYFPWLMAVLVLSMLNNFEPTRQLVMPFIALLIINYFLKNWSIIEAQFSDFYNTITEA